MSEVVVMPKSDWKNALDSVRSKAQITDSIKSGDLSGIIDSIGVKALNIPHLTAMAGGTFIPTSNTSVRDVTITHNLGVAANFYIVIAKDKPTSSIPIGSQRKGALDILSNVKGAVCERYYDSSTAVSSWNSLAVNGDETSIALWDNASVYVGAGKEYLWICGVMG